MSTENITRPAWQLIPQFESELAKRNQALVDFKSNEHADWLRLIQWFKMNWTVPEELAVANKLRNKFIGSKDQPRDIPTVVLLNQLKAEFSRSNPTPASASATSSFNSWHTIVHSRVETLTQSETHGSVDWKTLSQAYLKRRTDELPFEIPEYSFGSYLKYVGRKEQTLTLLQQMQLSYSAFRSKTNYYRGRSLNVVYSTGLFGMGKSTWADNSLRNLPPSFECSDPVFKVQFEECVSNHRIYRTNFADDPVQFGEKDEYFVQRSLAARLLWAHIKYEMKKNTTMVTYEQFWRYLKDNCLSLSPNDVVDYICALATTSSLHVRVECGNRVEVGNSRGRMVIFILNEVRSITNDYYAKCGCLSDAKYIRGMINAINQIQEEHGTFLFPIITSAKRGMIETYLEFYHCKELPIGPLSDDEIKEIVLDLWLRAQACVQKQNKNATGRANSTVDSGSSSSSEAKPLEDTADPKSPSSQDVQFELPAAFEALIKLMKGHPDVVRMFLCRFGSPQSSCSLEWTADRFIQRMNRLHGETADSNSKEMQELRDDIKFDLKYWEGQLRGDM